MKPCMIIALTTDGRNRCGLLAECRPEELAAAEPGEAVVLVGAGAVTESGRRRRHAAHRKLGHDVRGLLNTVTLYHDLLREAAKKPEVSIERYLEVLSKNRDGLHRGIEELLATGRPPGGDPTRFDLREVCRESVDLVGEGVAPPGLPAEPALVCEDRDGVRQALIEALHFVLDSPAPNATLTLDVESGQARVLLTARDVPRSGMLFWPLVPSEEDEDAGAG